MHSLPNGVLVPQRDREVVATRATRQTRGEVEPICQPAFEHETGGNLTTLFRGPAAVWALPLSRACVLAAAAGPPEACTAERRERRLGGLLEGEGGGKQG